MGQVGVILLGPFFLTYLTMSDFILLLLLLILLIIVAFRAFQPHIDIIQTGVNSYRILLWYNHFEEPEIKRRWVKLCEYGKR